MLEFNENGYLYRHFDSVADVFSQPITRRDNQLYNPMERHQKSAAWYGGHSRDKTMHFIEHGWPEGLELLDQMQGQIQLPPLRASKRKRVRGDRGDELSLDHVYSGRLETAWTRREAVVEHGSKRGAHMTLVIGVSALSTVKQQQALWRGVAGVKILTHAAALGIHTRVLSEATAVKAHPNDFRATCTTVELKSYRQRVLPDLIMAAAGLVGYHRTVNFYSRLIGSYRVSANFGHSTEAKTELFRLSGARKADEILVHVPYNCMSQQAAQHILDNVASILV